MAHNLLLDSQPLVIIPELACKIGLNEAVVLQQVHYWIDLNTKANKNYRDGFYWTYNSMENWAKQFPFWSINTIKRVFTKLENEEFLITGNYNKAGFDRTKWYRINYAKLDYSPLSQNEPMHSAKMSQPIPETITENNSNKVIGVQSLKNSCTEVTPKNNIFKETTEHFGKDRTDRMYEYVNWYIDTGYYSFTGKEHKTESPAKRMVFVNKLLTAVNNLFEYVEDDNYILEAMKQVLQSNNEDPTIYYFTTPKVLGYWLEQNEEIGFSALQDTKYQPVETYYQ